MVVVLPPPTVLVVPPPTVLVVPPPTVLVVPPPTVLVVPPPTVLVVPPPTVLVVPPPRVVVVPPPTVVVVTSVPSHGPRWSPWSRCAGTADGGSTSVFVWGDSPGVMWQTVSRRPGLPSDCTHP